MAKVISALTQPEKALFLPSLGPTVHGDTQATVDKGVVRWIVGPTQYTMDVGAGTLKQFFAGSLREIVYVVSGGSVAAVLVFHFALGRSAVKVDAASFRSELLVAEKHAGVVVSTVELGTAAPPAAVLTALNGLSVSVSYTSVTAGAPPNSTIVPTQARVVARVAGNVLYGTGDPMRFRGQPVHRPDTISVLFSPLSVTEAASFVTGLRGPQGETEAVLNPAKTSPSFSDGRHRLTTSLTGDSYSTTLAVSDQKYDLGELVYMHSADSGWACAMVFGKQGLAKPAGIGDHYALRLNARDFGLVQSLVTGAGNALSVRTSTLVPQHQAPPPPAWPNARVTGPPTKESTESALKPGVERFGSAHVNAEECAAWAACASDGGTPCAATVARCAPSAKLGSKRTKLVYASLEVWVAEVEGLAGVFLGESAAGTEKTWYVVRVSEPKSATVFAASPGKGVVSKATLVGDKWTAGAEPECATLIACVANDIAKCAGPSIECAASTAAVESLKYGDSTLELYVVGDARYAKASAKGGPYVIQPGSDATKGKMLVVSDTPTVVDVTLDAGVWSVSASATTDWVVIGSIIGGVVVLLVLIVIAVGVGSRRRVIVSPAP